MHILECTHSLSSYSPSTEGPRCRNWLPCQNCDSPVAARSWVPLTGCLPAHQPADRRPGPQGVSWPVPYQFAGSGSPPAPCVSIDPLITRSIMLEQDSWKPAGKGSSQTHWSHFFLKLTMGHLSPPQCGKLNCLCVF